MKFSWSDLFTSIMTVSGFASAAIVVCVVFTQMSGCQKASDVQSKDISVAKTQALSECIRSTQKVFECKEIFK